jgi:nucleoside-diphosphate-sugar epimerase
MAPLSGSRAATGPGMPSAAGGSNMNTTRIIGFAGTWHSQPWSTAKLTGPQTHVLAHKRSWFVWCGYPHQTNQDLVEHPAEMVPASVSLAPAVPTMGVVSRQISSPVPMSAVTGSRRLQYPVTLTSLHATPRTPLEPDPTLAASGFSRLPHTYESSALDFCQIRVYWTPSRALISYVTGSFGMLHVIVGAGAVGTATANLLADRGEQVRVISRHGTGPQRPGVERTVADAADAERLGELTRGAVALYNCASPAYHQWLTDWPPLHRAMLRAAQQHGLVLASACNVYGYGPVAGPITDATPLAATEPKLKLRADMWRDMLAAHQAGKLRATEVRASDYIEANSMLSFLLAKPLQAGKRVFVPAKLDVAHSWTSVRDVAAALVAAAATERAWGRAWLVPTNPPLTVRELAARFTQLNGAPAPRLTSLPYPALWAAGLFDVTVRELRVTQYQWNAPFTIDSSVTEREFGLAPTPIDAALASVAS